MASAEDDGVIKEGFLCPMCHIDMRSPTLLISHFQEQHSEEQDLLTSLKDLFGKAKKKLKLDEKDIEDFKQEITTRGGGLDPSIPQDPGITRSHIDYFKEVRRERLDHRTSETNKLIIRLDRLLRAEGSDKKVVAQELVTWLDGTTVTRCPSCAASFNLTRRQHHCRLCGCIMCNSCSAFLKYEEARQIINPVLMQLPSQKDDADTLRICLHCEGMLACRKSVQLSQNIQLPITRYYNKLQKVKEELQINIETYHKMYNSLTLGDTSYQLQDVQVLKGTLAKQAELMDAISKRIAELAPESENPKERTLQIAIRRSASNYIKEHVLSVPVLPSPVELEKIRQDRMLARKVENVTISAPRLQVKRVAVATGWTPNSSEVKPELTDDPLIDQMNIVRGYIEQARNAGRYDEVVSLRENLKMLKEMHRQNMIQKSLGDTFQQ